MNQQKVTSFRQRDTQDKVDEIAMHVQQTEVHQEGRSNSEPKIQQNYIPCGQGITDTCVIVGHYCNGQDLASARSVDKWQWYKTPLKSCRSSVGKQQGVSEAVAQADKNDHQKKEYKDSKNEAAPTKLLQEPAPKTLAKKGDGKDKAMAMGPGAEPQV